MCIRFAYCRASVRRGKKHVGFFFVVVFLMHAQLSHPVRLGQPLSSGLKKGRRGGRGVKNGQC